ncbi:MAG: toxin-antitoxin system YwqK family antitoxin [Fidelibacterota bacterium]
MKCLVIFLISCQFILAQADVNQIDDLGRKQGVWSKYWDDSKTLLQYKGQFVDNQPVGQFWYYYPQGEVRAIIEHLSKKQSYVTYYFENKEVMSEGMYLDKQRDSIWVNYNLQGLTLSMEKYRYGKLNGKKVIFYLQNQIETGEIKVLSEINYKDSLKSGAYSQFFSSGTLKLNGQYLLDKPVGLWNKFDTKGQLIQSSHFKNGLKHGWVINYGAHQEIVHTILYNKGVLLTGKDKEEYLRACTLKGIDPNE